MQAETNQPPKRRGYRFWISRFALVFGLGVLFYYGYCFGWWGRSSLLLQYLFQCSCPVASEEARYPKEVDVIVSACHQSYVELSPSGRFLQVNEEKSGLTSTYLLDLQTMEKIHVQSFSSFLTDDLGFIESGLEYYIVDRTTGDQYPIHRFTSLRPDAYVNGDVNLILLAEALRGAKNVFLINDSDIVVALASDFLTNPEHNFLTGWFDIPGFDTDRVEQFLQENNIRYQIITADFPGEALSPDGKFVARHDGIYLTRTNQMIVQAYPSKVRGWTNDGHGVIYSSNGPCLIQTNFLIFDDTACFLEVPQPVLRLKVPNEYLLPTESP